MNATSASRMRLVVLALTLVSAAALSVSLSCFPRVRITPPPADAPAEAVALAGASVLIGSGDIATCDSQDDMATARIIDSVLRADTAAGVEHAVFTTGDNAYPVGAVRDFQVCFGNSWGDTTKLIMKYIRPSLGNHDIAAGDGMNYFNYFGERAGPRGKGYYAYNIGTWRAIALNSEMTLGSRYSPADRGDQETWLKKELEDNADKKCTIAYMHRPLFSSGGHSGNPEVQRLWTILHEAGADLILAGHDHHYERFAPQTPAGVMDTVNGIPQIVIGTGGAELRGLRTPVRNSITRIQGHFGVLKLTLGAGEYRHAFIDTSGRVWDRGGGKCRGGAPAAAPGTAKGTAKDSS